MLRSEIANMYSSVMGNSNLEFIICFTKVLTGNKPCAKEQILYESAYAKYLK